MKKICVFTQTYSDDRSELFEYHNLDKDDVKFRNLFDLNIYSFHKCSDTYKNNITNCNYFRSIENLEIISYDYI